MAKHEGEGAGLIDVNLVIIKERMIHSQGAFLNIYSERLISLSVQNIALNSQGFQDLSVSSPDAMTVLFKKKLLNNTAKLFHTNTKPPGCNLLRSYEHKAQAFSNSRLSGLSLQAFLPPDFASSFRAQVKFSATSFTFYPRINHELFHRPKRHAELHWTDFDLHSRLERGGSRL